ncbi:hypothetical protein [Salinilacihabitans rarus]|uniref:hypothetical protein n=1 Tax=Salinilacihabitans rarus TaxID=2961596 RepID=UPI0020C8FB84|nr:hypothetical protein [Salinilacihabitans rarus]
MAVLKEYADSNERDGYYVHARVSGRSHPIPLQAPEVTEEIYRQIGYKPTRKGPSGGVQVPKDLTWTLYDVGLHWTEKSGPQGDPSDLDPDDLRDAAGPGLTEGDIAEILDFTQDYRGQYQSRVKNLREKFTDESGDESSGTTPPSITSLLEELSDKPSFSDDVEERLDAWEPESIKDDDYDPDEDGGLFDLHYTTRSEYRESLSLVPDLQTRLQEYDDHPWEVAEVKAASGDTSDDSNGLRVSFHTTGTPELNEWRIADYRGTGDGREFTISTGIGSRSYEFEIEENFVSDFDMTITYESVGKFDIPPEDFWGYEVEEQNPNEMMHALIADFHHLITVIEEFFDGLTSFELESMNPSDYSVYLP